LCCGGNAKFSKFFKILRKYCVQTYPTNEAIRVPLAVQSRYIVLHDGAIAAGTLGRKHVVVVGATVRFAVTFVEALLAELVATLGAEEVLRVPSFLQGGDTFLGTKKKDLNVKSAPWTTPKHATHIQNRTIAVGTSWREQIVIIRFTIGMTVPFEKVACAQLLVAMVARKVLRMPGLAQGRDHLADNWFVARIAAPLLGGVDALTAHFGLQTAQHRVQLITTVLIAFRLLSGCRFLGDNSGLKV
jgi:hypothetical protein